MQGSPWNQGKVAKIKPEMYTFPNTVWSLSGKLADILFKTLF